MNDIDLQEIEITDSRKWNYIEIMFYPYLLVMNTLYPNDKIKHKIVLYFSVCGLLKGYSFKAINFLINQSLLESNNGKSNLTQIGLNVIGMRCVSQRQTTQTGCYTTNSNGDFGTYSSIYDCVKDRFLWGSYFNEPKTYPEIKTLAQDVYNPSEGVIYTDKIDSMPNILWCVILVLLSFPISLLIIYKLIKWVK
jgi:hypothetical protein